MTPTTPRGLDTMGRGAGASEIAVAPRRAGLPRTESQGRAVLHLSEHGSELLVPTMVANKQEGDRLSFLFLEDGRFTIVAGNDMDSGYRNSLDRETFALAASSLADHVLAGGDHSAVEILDGGERAPGMRQTVILKPYRFGRGRGRHIAIGYANLREDGSASLRWGDGRRSFTNFILRAEDLRDASALLRRNVD